MSTQVDLFTTVEPTSVSPAIAKPFVMCSAVNNTELLLSQPNGSVNMIYSDILYGTGRDFGDYQDLKPIRSEIESHYLPRLIEMKRVLKQNGSIYLQMDTRINHWMRCLMDDVFGYENFRNEIVFSYNGGGVSKKCYPKKHDIILFYSVSDKYYFNNEKKPYSALSSQNLLWKHRNKKRLDELNDGTPITDVWADLKFKINYQEDEYTGYATQKTKELLSRIILASTEEGDTVSDYYLGSGTTAVVCQELNRNFIGCDINPKAIEITNSRLIGGV